MNKSLILLVVALFGAAAVAGETRKEPTVQQICKSAPGPIILGGSSTTVTLMCWDPEGHLNATTIPNNKTLPAAEIIRLEPGWKGTLLFQFNQTMIVGKNSSLVSQNVTVVPGHQYVEPQKGIRVTVNLTSGFQYATIFFLNATNTTKPSQPQVNLSLNTTLVPQYNQSLFLNGNVTLYPGWNNTLRERINQTLIPLGNSSQFVTQNVTVFPGWYLLDGYEGIRANPTFPNGLHDYVTIFFENKTPKLNQNVLRGQVVPQFNQNLFRFENATLSPGWFGPLTTETQQILVPAANSTQFEGKQSVLVVPGWMLLKSPYEGIRAQIQNSQNVTDYVTLYFNQKQNLTRLEEANKTIKLAEEAVKVMELFA